MLWLWLFVVIGFFTAARFRLDHYIFPAAPACCLLAAVGWRRAVAGTHAAATRLALVAIAATFLVGGAIAGAAIMRINLGLGRSALMLPIVLCARRRHAARADRAGTPVDAGFAGGAASHPGRRLRHRSYSSGSRYWNGRVRRRLWARRSRRRPLSDTPIGVYQLEWGASIRYYADRRVARAPGSRRGARVLPLLAVRDTCSCCARTRSRSATLQHDLHEVAAAEAIVGRTGRYLRRQVWGAVTVVSQTHARGPDSPARAAQSFGRGVSTARPKERSSEGSGRCSARLSASAASARFWPRHPAARRSC